LGARQSGVPMLRFADLEQDVDLLDSAHAVADDLLCNYPDAHNAILNVTGRKSEYLQV
jgi:ATP-dependent DNA helicase RecG